MSSPYSLQTLGICDMVLVFFKTQTYKAALSTLLSKLGLADSIRLQFRGRLHSIKALMMLLGRESRQMEIPNISAPLHARLKIMGRFSTPFYFWVE